jgi:hypothetical protein
MKDIGSGKRGSDELEGNDKHGEVWRVSRISVVLNWLNLNLSLAGDTSQTYLQFLMLHACSYTICFEFFYISWCFYAFSETNLLTRYHSASFLFSAVLCFRKVT